MHKITNAHQSPVQCAASDLLLTEDLAALEAVRETEPGRLLKKKNASQRKGPQGNIERARRTKTDARQGRQVSRKGGSLCRWIAPSCGLIELWRLIVAQGMRACRALLAFVLEPST